MKKRSALLRSAVVETLEERRLLSSSVLYRVAAGGPALSDVPGWTADTSANPSTFSNSVATGNNTFSTTQPIDLSDPSIPAGTPAALFQNERWAPSGTTMNWSFPVTAGGSYTVQLYFAEIYPPAASAGGREFNVAIDGGTVLTNFDVGGTVGLDKGIVKTFTVTDASSALTIALSHGAAENPEIQGIQILQNTTGAGLLGVAAPYLPFGLGSAPYITYGSVAAGLTETHGIIFTNMGKAGDPNITITSATLSDTNASSFIENFNNSNPVTLAPGQSTTINVTYDPQTTGAISATLNVNYSGSSSPLQIPLRAWEVAAGNGDVVAFGKSTLTGIGGLTRPTQLQFGPDGKLYVSEEDGLIYQYTITRNGPSQYVVSATNVINLVQQIPNHDDNGALDTAVNTRLVTGILVVGTAANPVIYVSSSDPRIGGGPTGTPSGADTNSGIVSRLTWNGTSWTKLDLVVGLPRSEVDHAPNGLALNAATNTLYLAIAGNTNMGAPSNNFGDLPEYAYSAAVLSINLTAIGNTTYDLPTLTDNNVANPSLPFGGDFGAHQAKIVAGSPVQVYASGFRNPYSLVLTSNGYLYTDDNGPNAGWGDTPIFVNGQVTNQISEPGSFYEDNVHVITGPGEYFGHPDPARASTSVTFGPNNLSPITTADPQEANFEIPGPANGALALNDNSSDGLSMYTASNFDGKLQGDILQTSFGNQIWDMKLSADGLSVVSYTPLFSGVGAAPLGITSEGDSQIFPGTVWVADIGTGQIIIYEPINQGAITGVDDPTVDEDTDGFSNHDEILNGTDPGNPGSIPTAFGTNTVSNLLNPDDDGDGIPDAQDPFPLDPLNGRGTSVPLHYAFSGEGVPVGGLLGLGFTGTMINGTTNYLSTFPTGPVTAGGAAGVLTIGAVSSGDALGSQNNQQNAYQFGINVGPSSPSFSAHTQIGGPFAGLTPLAGQSMGLYIGTGDQDNYLKLVITSTGVQTVEEINGVDTFGQTAPIALPGPTDIDLYLTVNPANDTVQPQYIITNSAGVQGNLINLGTPLSIPASWLTNPTFGLAVGLISTDGGTTPFNATWNFIGVDTPPVPDTPFGGTAPPVPGVIQAENFDNGGQGVSYNIIAPTNNGGDYRPTETVGIVPSQDVSGNEALGYLRPGDWLKYTVNVATTGVYNIAVRVATATPGGTFHIESNGVNITGPITLPTTGGFNTWQTINVPSVNLTAGVQTLRLVIDTAAQAGQDVGNINYFDIEPAATESPFGGTPWAVPGTVEAENFDNGGQGLAYNIIGATNDGGDYRPTETVGIVPSGDVSGNEALGFLRPGDWLNYTVNVVNTGTYTLAVRVASGTNGGTFHLEFNNSGVNATGEITLPGTGGFNTWQTILVPNVSLTAGTQVMKLVFDTAATPGQDIGNINYFTFTQPYTGTAFGGTPWAVPGKIEAENFDNGGEGVAYHDTNPVNEGGQYRLSDGVDIETTTDTGGGFDVGHVAVGEWLKYTINVGTTGSYTISTRVASETGGTFHYEVDGTSVGGEVTLPNTGGWQTFQTVSTAAFNLSAGPHVIRLVMDTTAVSGQDIGNFNWLDIEPVTTEGPFGGTAWPVPGQVEFENYDTGGEGVAYHDTNPANEGGAYRLTEGVDVEPTTDTGGGFDVGHVQPSEWLKYTVNVASTGTYIIQSRVASETGGTFHYEVDGTSVGGEVTLPNTGGWQTYTTVPTTSFNLTAGQHVIRVVMDSSAQTGQDIGNFNYFTVVSSGSTNQPPTVNAGTSQIVTFGTAANLSGTASDDGLPSGTLTTTWSQTGGPGTVQFANASSLNTTATFSTNGVYTLQLAAFDGQLTSNATVQITVNKPPVVSAGSNQSITLPATAALAGTVSDDGLPTTGTLVSTWSMSSGPGTVQFTNANSPTTTASFSTSGMYVLKLSATDGSATTSSTVTITVSPAALATVVVDDSSASGVTITGSWTKHTGSTSINGEFLSDGNTAKGTKSVRYTPTLPSAGTYQVFGRWGASGSNSSTTPFDIISATGTTTVVENQRKNGGVWVLLGTFTFNATGGSVLIRTNGTTGFVIADAVEFVQVS